MARGRYRFGQGYIPTRVRLSLDIDDRCWQTPSSLWLATQPQEVNCGRAMVLQRYGHGQGHFAWCKQQRTDQLVNVSGTLYFRAADATNGNELWKSDGTAGGTVLVKNTRPGLAAESPSAG